MNPDDLESSILVGADVQEQEGGCWVTSHHASDSKELQADWEELLRMQTSLSGIPGMWGSWREVAEEGTMATIRAALCSPWPLSPESGPALEACAQMLDKEYQQLLENLGLEPEWDTDDLPISANSLSLRQIQLLEMEGSPGWINDAYGLCQYPGSIQLQRSAWTRWRNIDPQAPSITSQPIKAIKVGDHEFNARYLARNATTLMDRNIRAPELARTWRGTGKQLEEALRTQWQIMSTELINRARDIAERELPGALRCITVRTWIPRELGRPGSEIEDVLRIAHEAREEGISADCMPRLALSHGQGKIAVASMSIEDLAGIRAIDSWILQQCAREMIRNIQPGTDPALDPNAIMLSDFMKRESEIVERMRAMQDAQPASEKRSSTIRREDPGRVLN